MKILIVSSHLSHPTDAGNRAAIMAQVNILKHLGHEVHFLFVDMSLKHIDIQEMENYWVENFHIYKQNPIGKTIRIFIDFYRIHFNHGYWKYKDHYVSGLVKYTNRLQCQIHFDAIIVQYMRFAPLLTKVSIPRKAIFTHDVFAYKDIHTGEPFYETCTADEESKAIRCCPNVFAIQESEANYYSIISPHSKVYTVYSPYQVHKQEIRHDSNILYVASSMDFNVNGIQWFIDHVWNLILQMHPEANLLIAGSVCNKIKVEHTKNISLLGYVESLEDFYSKGDIVINPVYQGTGLKIKTFEALSFGKVTIVHPHSKTGIYKKDQVPLYSASTTEEWIDALDEILNPEFNREDVKEKAISYIEDMDNYIEGQYKDFLSQNSKTDIPKKIHYCWFGKGKKSPLILHCIATWKKILTDYEIKEWNESNFDINSVPYVKEAYSKKMWAFVSDYVRLHALYTEGGVYLDTDVEILKPIDKFLSYSFFTGQELHLDIFDEKSILPNRSRNPEFKQVLGIGICSAVLGATSGLPFLKDCLNYYNQLHFSLENRQNLIIVNILAVILEKYGYKYYTDQEQLLKGNMKIFKPNIFAGMTTYDEKSYALHLYNGSWTDKSTGLKHKLRNMYPHIYLWIQKMGHAVNYYSKDLKIFRKNQQITK